MSVTTPRTATKAKTMARIVDLTLTIHDGMRGVTIEKLHTIDEHGWNTRNLRLYSHSGTHMDAPLHFEAGGDAIDCVPLEHCVLSAWVIDLLHVRPKELIRVEHLGPAAEQVGRDDGLLLKTGWSRHVDRPEYYRNNFPRISEELAEWCVERRVRLLGVESPSVADVNSVEEITRIHHILLSSNIVIVEGLTNLDALTENRVLFCAAPLKIEGGDGSPCRAFAIEGAPEGILPMASL